MREPVGMGGRYDSDHRRVREVREPRPPARRLKTFPIRRDRATDPSVIPAEVNRWKTGSRSLP